MRVGCGCIEVVVCNNFRGIFVNQDKGIFVRTFLSFKWVEFNKYVAVNSSTQNKTNYKFIGAFPSLAIRRTT